MKATQLEQMKEDYSYIMETKERTKEQINQGEEVCKHLIQLFFEIMFLYKMLHVCSFFISPFGK